jgi:hypothetical protein
LPDCELKLRKWEQAKSEPTGQFLELVKRFLGGVRNGAPSHGEQDNTELPFGNAVRPRPAAGRVAEFPTTIRVADSSVDPDRRPWPTSGLATNGTESVQPVVPQLALFKQAAAVADATRAYGQRGLKSIGKLLSSIYAHSASNSVWW